MKIRYCIAAVPQAMEKEGYPEKGQEGYETDVLFRKRYSSMYVIHGRAKPVLCGPIKPVPSWRNHIQGWMTV